MKTIDFWFDPISPYAYLAFERLPEALEGLSYSVSYRPILFAALLKHWEHKGPAEIEPKRAWTFRQVQWLAHRSGVPIETPARHPFNPITLSRLAWATAPEGATPSRYACATILAHVWQGGGADAEDPSRLAALRERLAPRRDPASEPVKQMLREATEAAIGQGIFGVPTSGVDGRLFWGLDALPMLAGYLRGDPWFDGPAWQTAGVPRPGVVRRVAPP
jgi:2-hydroxychromene-2-carboxylate isomerase